jgi:putative acetyltransferase
VSVAVPIRAEKPGDELPIADVIERAFATHPYSSHNEQRIVAALRDAGALEVSLVAEHEDKIAGHISFSRVTIEDGTTGWFGLGPVSVAPEHQRRGIGSALVRAGLERIRSRGAAGCVLLGFPAYYGRFGFRADSRLVLEGAAAEHFLALAFGSELPRGRVAYHAAFGA